MATRVPKEQVVSIGEGGWGERASPEKSMEETNMRGMQDAKENLCRH